MMGYLAPDFEAARAAERFRHEAEVDAAVRKGLRDFADYYGEPMSLEGLAMYLDLRGKCPKNLHSYILNAWHEQHA